MKDFWCFGVGETKDWSRKGGADSSRWASMVQRLNLTFCYGDSFNRTKNEPHFEPRI